MLFVMLPSSLLAFTAGLLLPLIAASSTPICAPSTGGYQETLGTLCQTFRAHLAKEAFNSNQEVYGVPPVRSFGPMPALGTTKHGLNHCITNYGSLIKSCAMNNHSIWESGSIDADCEAYWNKNTFPVGTATETVIAASGTGTPILRSVTSNTQTSISTSSGKPTATKPSVGSTSLGTSGAGIIQGSGITLIGVAFVFTWFL